MMTDFRTVFLNSTKPLNPGNAVGALLLLEDGRYIMQLRDLVDRIFYPGHWGLFGGAVDEGEDDATALIRELDEELSFTPESISPFVRLDFDLSTVGAGKIYRAIFEVPVTNMQFDAFVLREGLAFEAIAAQDLLLDRKVTPYDAFAVWLHFAQDRIVPSRQSINCALDGQGDAS